MNRLGWVLATIVMVLGLASYNHAHKRGEFERYTMLSCNKVVTFLGH